MPLDFNTYLAWQFDSLIPGTFKRNRPEFAHHDYPILAPLPPHKTRTRALEDCGKKGPFLYFVLDGLGRLCYVGKSKETSVIKRWVRPGIGGPSSHYWTHSTVSGGCVFNIAKGIQQGCGPYSLRYTPMTELMVDYAGAFSITAADSEDVALNKMEQGFINILAPAWNSRGL